MATSTHKLDRLRLSVSRASRAVAQAIDYSLNLWQALTLQLGDGAVPIDNNHLERQTKPWKLVRKAGC